MNTLLSAFFLALVSERIVAALTDPLKKQYPDWPFWWLMLYPTWIIGGLLAYFAGINLFSEIIPTLSQAIGQILTAVVVGGGGNLLHDIFDRPPTQRITATSASAGMMTAMVHTSEPKEN